MTMAQKRLFLVMIFVCGAVTALAQPGVPTRKWSLIEGRMLIDVPATWEPASYAKLVMQTQNLRNMQGALGDPDGLDGFSVSYQEIPGPFPDAKALAQTIAKNLRSQGWSVTKVDDNLIDHKPMALVSCNRSVDGLHVMNFLAAGEVDGKLLILTFLGAGQDAEKRLFAGKYALFTAVFPSNPVHPPAPGIKSLELSEPPPEVSRSQAPSSHEGTSAPFDLGEIHYYSFPSLGIKIHQPDGFVEAENFDGLSNPVEGASIMVLSFPTPPQEILEGFNTRTLLEQGMILLQRKDIQIDSRSGALMEVSQTARGTKYLKWVFVIGDENRTLIANAVYPATKKDALSDLMRKSALSIQPQEISIEASLEDLGFTIDPAPTWEHFHVWNKSLALSVNEFSEDGVNTGPLFMVVKSTGPPNVDNRKDFASYRFHKMATMEDHSISSIEPITIDALEGFEVWGTARKTSTGLAVLLYEVILFDGGFYYLLSGSVDMELKDRQLPDFQQMARSFKRR